MMQKRQYRHTVSALIITLSVFASVQSQSTEIPKVGVVSWGLCERDTSGSPFMIGLSDLGYKPGETVVIECRSAGQRYDGITEAVAELVELDVDVLVGFDHETARVAHDATNTIPIVSIMSGDPVASGLARSLAQPGGNVTGMTYYATELTGKRLELLQSALPELESVDVLANPNLSYLPFEDDTKRAAAQLGIAVRTHQVTEPAEVESAFSEMEAKSAQAVFVLPDLMLAFAAQQIADLALKHNLPTMTWASWFVNAGCLMAYSVRYDTISRRLAFYVDRVLKGASPGELPIEQPTNFDFSINLKTANALGLELPQTLMLSADDFIE